MTRCKARAAVKTMLGEVMVFEDETGIVAQVDVGRCVYINNGAEDPIPALYTKRIRLI